MFLLANYLQITNKCTESNRAMEEWLETTTAAEAKTNTAQQLKSRNVHGFTHHHTAEFKNPETNTGKRLRS